MKDPALASAVFLRLMAAYGICLATGFLLKLSARNVKPARETRRSRGPGIGKKFGVFFVFQAALMTLACWWPAGLGIFLALLFSLSVYEVARLSRHQDLGDRAVFNRLLAYGLLIALGLSLTSCLFFAVEFPVLLAVIFLLIAVFDGFSQICGEIFEGPKIVPVLSPHKTWSGFLGGLIFCVIAALFARKFVYPFSNAASTALLGLAIGVLAFLGDVTASAVKRRLGVKDFSNFLGSQGGVLDRLDSLIWIGPALGMATLVQAGFFFRFHF